MTVDRELIFRCWGQWIDRRRGLWTPPSELTRACQKTRGGCREKWQLALELLDRVREECTYEAIVLEAGYGELRPFLYALDQGEHWCGAQIPAAHCFWSATIALEGRAQPGRRPRCFPLRLQHPKPVEVARVRGCATIPQAWRRPGPERWVRIERHRDGWCKYYLRNAPRRTSVCPLLTWAYQRWKIEQRYQSLKEELGLDPFAGRSWRGLPPHRALCFRA